MCADAQVKDYDFSDGEEVVTRPPTTLIEALEDVFTGISEIIGFTKPQRPPTRHEFNDLQAMLDRAHVDLWSAHQECAAARRQVMIWRIAFVVTICFLPVAVLVGTAL